MAFPSSPVDGQVFGLYTYSAATPGWLKTPVITTASGIDNYAKNNLRANSITYWSKGSGSFVTTPVWDTTKNLYNGGGLLIPFSVGTKTANDYYDGMLIQIMASMVTAPWKLRFAAMIDTGATFASSDLILEYYDGSAAAPIGLIPTTIINNVFTVEMVILPTNTIGVNSRIRIRAQTGSTTCVGNLRIADIVVYPQPATSAPPVSSRILYTPVFTGFSGTNTPVIRYKRITDDMLIHGKFLVGTSAASVASVSIPSPWTGSSMLGEIVGWWILETATASQVKRGTLIMGAGVLNFREDDYVNSNAPFSAFSAFSAFNANSISTNAGQRIEIWAQFPVDQWAASVNLIGVNEPMYISNNSTSINTGAGTSSSYFGSEGSPIRANTIAVSYDGTLPRTPQPNETTSFQFRSKVDGSWVSAIDAGVPSLFVPSFGGPLTYTASATYLRSVFTAKVTAGVVRVFFPSTIIGSTAWEAGVPTGIYWSQIIAAADGYDNWRIRIGQASVSEQVPKLQATYTATNVADGSYFGSTASVIEDTHSVGFNVSNEWVVPFPGIYTLSLNITDNSSGSRVFCQILQNGTQLVYDYVAPITGYGNARSSGITQRFKKGDLLKFQRGISGTPNTARMTITMIGN